MNTRPVLYLNGEGASDCYIFGFQIASGYQTEHRFSLKAIAQEPDQIAQITWTGPLSDIRMASKSVQSEKLQFFDDSSLNVWSSDPTVYPK